MTGKKGITSWRGSIITTKHGDVKVVGTIHPARLFKQKGDKGGALPWQWRYVIQQDIVRAVEESNSPKLDLPIRSVIICRSSVDLYNFLERHKHLKEVTIDIESIKQIPCAIGLGFNSKEAISVPLMNVGSWRMQGNGMSDRQYAEIWQMLDRFLADPSIMIVGQNFKYDHDKLLRPCGFRIGAGRLAADTSLMAHTLNPEYPINLAFLTSINTREPFYKDDGHEFNPQKHPFEQFLKYNGTDVLVTKEIKDRFTKDIEENGLHDFYYGFVNKLHDFYMDLERKGFKVDEAVRIALIEKYVERFNSTMDRLEKIVGHGVNVNSSPQVRNLLFGEMRFPERAKVDDEVLSLLYANHAKKEEQREVITAILEGRQIRKTLSTYLFAPCDFDGRMRCSYRIVGTETGRSSTSKLEPPLRPSLVVGTGSKAKIKHIGLMFHNITKHGEIGGDIREMFVVDEGCWFGEIDMSQAEARIVALLANAADLLKLFDSGIDVHKTTASWVYGVAYNKITSTQRQVCKHVRHAGNYGQGPRGLVDLLAVKSKQLHVDLNISEYRARQILTIFHRYTPNIQAVFHEEIKKALNTNNRTLINPYGRPRQLLGRWGDELFREAFAQIPQSTVPDHLRMAAMRAKIRMPEIEYRVESHDAVTWSCKIELFNQAAKILKEEIEKPIDFAGCTLPRGTLIIPAEVKVGRENYKRFEDYEVAA